MSLLELEKMFKLATRLKRRPTVLRKQRQGTLTELRVHPIRQFDAVSILQAVRFTLQSDVRCRAELRKLSLLALFLLCHCLLTSSNISQIDIIFFKESVIES